MTESLSGIHAGAAQFVAPEREPEPSNPQSSATRPWPPALMCASASTPSARTPASGAGARLVCAFQTAGSPLAAVERYASLE